MSTRYYPLYQRGNPQLRVFLPNFWMKLIRPEEPLPPNMIMFQTSIEMTKYDVENYLKKIYNIPVVEVKTTIKMGEIKKCFHKNHLIKDNDYKEAVVTLPVGYNFEFPDFTTSKTLSKEKHSYKVLKEKYESLKYKISHNHGVPSWFRY